MRRWGVFVGFLLLMVAAELFTSLFKLSIVALPFFPLSNPLVKRILDRDPAVQRPYGGIASGILQAETRHS
jgi:hypothetical protein